jgi:penicillin-binding protein 1A
VTESRPELVIPAKQAEARRSRRSRWLLLFVALALGVPAGFLFAHVVHVPLVKSLEDYQPAIITRIYDRNGVGFAEYAIQKRIVVGKRDMAPQLVNAILATEDADFYHHGGVNPKAIVRAGIRDLLAGKRVEGASTLTQQVAKQLFFTREKRWRRKIDEIFAAIEIERTLTKDQILELYANQMYLGHGAYGVEAASRLYFGKHAKDLTVPEAAMIAGLMRSPNSASPILHPQAALARRNHVLRRMLDEKYLNKPQFQQAVNTPLVLGSYKEEAPKVGAYFSEEIRQYIERSEKFGIEDLYKGGLKVYSTLDLGMQQAAEASLQHGLRVWDHRRGFRKPARNVTTEGIDPAAYKDPSWTNEPYAVDKLYTAVVMSVGKGVLIARVKGDTMLLPPPAFAWTGKKTMEGAVARGDLVSLRLNEDSKTHARMWKLDQVPAVQGAVVILDVKTGEVRASAATTSSSPSSTAPSSRAGR